MEKSEPKYRRILLKLSGEILGDEGSVLSAPSLSYITEELVLAIEELNVQLAVVVGGGNIVRGKEILSIGIERVTGDQMGMLATLINSLALKSTLINKGVKAEVMAPPGLSGIAEDYSRDRALELLSSHYIILLAGGTGNPFFTTDSAAALRAAELRVDVVLKGTKVDGVYSGDPVKDPNAKKFDVITYEEILERKLGVIDLTAATLLKENSIPLVVFNMRKKGNLRKVLLGESVGTLVK